MSPAFIVTLLTGAAAMLAVMLAARKRYGVSALRCLAFSALLTVCGVAGAKVMFAIETGGASGGVSFFGAVFFPPAVMALAALIARTPVRTVLDLCAPAECVMLALLKVRCVIDGCCYGRLLYATQTVAIRFPSQIVELLASLVILAVLFRLMGREKWRGKLYPCYLLIYGGTRFVLNTLRDTEPFVWLLPAGHFWSLIAMAIGALWLALAFHEDKKVRIST